MSMSHCFLAILLFLLFGGHHAQAGGKQRPPNFILIFVDDQGYQDLGCFGSAHIKTPHLDRMAREGTRFTDFYALAPVCSASRAALMTGCYPPRVGITGVLFPRHRMGLNPEEVTIAKMLKRKEYATACVGKWHLGHHPQFLPTRHGFDRYYGIPYSNDMDPKKGASRNLDRAWMEKDGSPWNVPLLRDDVEVERPVRQETLTRRYTEEAVRFIRTNAERPFFLYFPHTMPHIPLFVSEEFYDSDPHRAYAVTIAEIDWSVGQVLDTVRSLGIDEETMVVYTSDNGPWLGMKHHGGSALPLRDGKFSTYEGGMRVPCLMRWPGRIPSDRVSDGIGAAFDLLPTFAALAGVSLDQDPLMDGVDLSDLVLGRGPSARNELIYYKGANIQAIRRGPWKLNLGRVQRRRNRDDLVIPPTLHHLPSDLGEKKNVIDAHPDLVASLHQRVREFGEALKATSRPAGTLDSP